MSKKLTYEQVKEYIEQYGYKLLSDEYVNNSTKLNIMCPDGHVYDVKYSHFQRGHRCPICSGNIRLTHEQVSSYIEQYGYKLLSDEYVNNSTKLNIMCPDGHVYDVTYAGFQQGKRCAKCVNKNIKYTYEEIQQHIESLGYKLLSNEYVNARTKLDIMCPDGHVYGIIYSSFQSGRRCSVCAGNKKLTYEQYTELAQSKGGSFLSTEIKNISTKVKWKCANGHEFKMTYNRVQQGNWCPECSTGRSERVVKAYFEQLLNMKFEKARPDWLMGKHNLPLELDGYNEEYKIAFEYQGIQHYERNKYFHKNKKSFENQLKRDEIKRQKCQEMGILLIEIPSLTYKINQSDIKSIIENRFNGVNRQLPKCFYDVEVDLSSVYSDDQIDIEQMTKWYKDDKMSTVEIGEKVGKSHVWVGSELKKNGVIMRNCGRERFIPTKKQIEQLKMMRQKKETIKEICDYLGTSCGPIYRILKEHNIK